MGITQNQLRKVILVEARRIMKEEMGMGGGESLGQLFSSFKDTVTQLNDSVADDDYNGAVQGMKKAKEILQKMSDKIGELDIEHYGPAGEELQELVDMLNQ